MVSKQRPLSLITLVFSMTMCAILLPGSARSVGADAVQRTSSEIAAPFSAPDYVGPVPRSLPHLIPETHAVSRQGVDKQTAWNRSFSSTGPGLGNLLYDNGEILNDTGDPATQLSLQVDGALSVFRFIAEVADDFVLTDGAPDTNVQVTGIRAAFNFFGTGADMASPSQTWTNGIYVVVYNNSPANEPSGFSDFEHQDSMSAGAEMFNDAVASQLVLSQDFTETFVDTGCRPCWVVDMPVNFALAKNTRYWLSLIPRFPALPQSAWCLSEENRGFSARRGATFDFPPWVEIAGNAQNGACIDPAPPPPGTIKSLSFQVFGQELPGFNIACCDESTGMCRDIVSPMSCLPSEVANIGATCSIVDCQVVTGSCCDDAIADCMDNANIADCTGPGERFTPNVSCSELSPSCGTTDLGACCLSGQSCFDLNPTDCSQIGGRWNVGMCASFTCPPDNDDCDTSPTIISDGFFPFTTIGASTDGPPGASVGCPTLENDVWFQYFSTCEGLLTVSLCFDADYDSAVEIYENCICPTNFLSLEGCDDDGCGVPMGASSLTVPVQASTCYLIRIGGVGGATGSGTLIVGCTPPNEGACCIDGSCTLTTMGDCMGDFFPDQPCSPITCPPQTNDDCDNAIAITQDGTYPFETTNATTDGPADSPGGVCTEVNQDIWFTYTATCNGLLDVSVCGAVDYDSALAIYDGCACPPAGGPLACDNNGCGPGGASEIRNLPVIQGNCYLIRVGGADAAEGTGSLTISCMPAAFCCLADVSGDSMIDINDVPPMVTALLNPPSMGAPEFCPADVNEDMVIDGLDIGPFVTRLIDGAICQLDVTGACCFADGMCMEIAQADCLVSMGAYEGNDTVCAPNPCPQPPEPPVNDECGGAISLTCNTQTVFSNELDTDNLADDPVFSCHFGGAAQGEGTLWFTFVASDTDALLSTCNTLPPVTDTLIAVYDAAGCPVMAGDEIGCNEDAGGACQRLSELCVTGLMVGQEYTVQVATFNGSPRGDITLDLACPCPQGACCFADGSCQELRSDECLAANGDFQGDGVSCDPNPCSPPVSVECCIGDLNVDGMIDSMDIPSFVATLLNPPLFGTPDFCRADIDENGVADARDIEAFIPLTLTPDTCPVPLNDDCSSPLLLSCNTRIVVENTYATTDVSDPEYTCLFGGQGQGDGTLWFSFVATDTSAFISTCDFLLPDIDTILAVYDTQCPSIGNELACNEDAGGPCDRFSELCVGGLTMGNTYYVQVSSSGMNELGFISVEIACPCP